MVKGLHHKSTPHLREKKMIDILNDIKKLEDIELAISELYLCQNRNEMDRQNKATTEYIHAKIKKLIMEKRLQINRFEIING